ncbi:MAG: ATP synthase subunit I [Blastocatellia bacterium]|nr:ATP synthase subunit I [Blastocatellia bacterium]
MNIRFEIEMERDEGKRVEQRFQRNMNAYILVALAASMGWGGRRMVMGVVLGSALSIFNKRWLQGSVAAILGSAVQTQSSRVPPFTAAKFILRYFIIALVIGAALWTGGFDPIGIAIGFSAFVGGVMIEAGYQLCLIFRSTKNEEKISSKQ